MPQENNHRNGASKATGLYPGGTLWLLRNLALIASLEGDCIEWTFAVGNGLSHRPASHGAGVMVYLLRAFSSASALSAALCAAKTAPLAAASIAFAVEGQCVPSSNGKPPNGGVLAPRALAVCCVSRCGSVCDLSSCQPRLAAFISPSSSADPQTRTKLLLRKDLAPSW